MVTQTPPATPRVGSQDEQIVIISHSTLFYWWPVWAVGYILAIMTYFGDYHMAIVPSGTIVKDVSTVDDPKTLRKGFVVPEKKVKELPRDDNGEPENPRLYISKHSSYGVTFAVILLAVIIITNVPLRGMWSFVVIMFAIMLSIIFSFAGWWDRIFQAIHFLDIRINMGGYFFISTVLLIAWLITFFLFDHQIYAIFTPGALKVCEEIGGGEKNYDTTAMTLEKQRSDLFRHWILGLGSGDLIVNTSGAQVHHISLPNVLFINKKLHQIQEMLREKAVVRGG
jgi:hypothetical protein